MAKVFGLRQQISNSSGADGWRGRANRRHPEPSGPVLLSWRTRHQGGQAAADSFPPRFLPSSLGPPPTASALSHRHYLALKDGKRQLSRKYPIISGEFQRLVTYLISLTGSPLPVPPIIFLLVFQKPGFTYISFDGSKWNKMEATWGYY